MDALRRSRVRDDKLLVPSDLLGQTLIFRWESLEAFHSPDVGVLVPKAQVPPEFKGESAAFSREEAERDAPFTPQAQLRAFLGIRLRVLRPTSSGKQSKEEERNEAST